MSPSNDANAPAAGAATPSGTADFTTDGGVIVYEIHLVDMSSPPAAAEIHLGAPSDATPVVVAVPLTPDAAGNVDGQGTIDASQIRGRNPDGSPMAMDDLVKAMRNGNAHVDVRSNKGGNRAAMQGPITSQGP